ncbi:MAG TPA: single-stranded-DNA-specific exonuclease RecJ [Desulfotignum sp.]|nr:single-stranded-DNA-specific exonuclease RecJ [Desulfotignum sp.]
MANILVSKTRIDFAACNYYKTFSTVTNAAHQHQCGDMNTHLTFATPDPAGVRLLSQGLGCHPVTAGLIWNRGFTTVDTARFFLNPNFNHLTDPFSMKDMQKAVERIHTAVVNREKILIFGDFDADGVTATTLIHEFLSLVDADVSWYIPHRIKEGYGIAPAHIHMAADRHIDLIITVDCGISSMDAVAAAAMEDMDVIVTDHHEPGHFMPAAWAILDPKQPDCASGLSFLAGVGVVFFLVMALRRFFRENGIWNDFPEPGLVQFLDLFAIGTIGDMVPLVHENRILCMAGIKQIRKNPRPGIQALAAAARLDISRLDSDDLSYKIVPRINAAGRMSHARICVSLLSSRETAEARKTAFLLDEMNVRRQTIEREIVNDIENRILQDPSLLKNRLLLLWDKKWHPSVLGIAASKLARKYVCPVLLLACNGETAMGSGRSINHINIHQALTENAHLLEKFGGHAMATGLTLDKKQLPDLLTGLNNHLETRYFETDFRKTLTIDARIGLDDISFDLALELDRLRPFGMANPEPVFLSRRLKVISSHILGGSHRKMLLQQADNPAGPLVEAFHFNAPDILQAPGFYDQVAFRLKISKFKARTPQMIIEDT